MSDIRLSVIIPVLNEAAHLGHLLDDLGALRAMHEIVVVDGGSLDGTPALATARGARVIVTPMGRGAQLRVGAAASSGPMLAFLHADARLSAASVAALDRLAETRTEHAWAYRLCIDDPRLAFRIVAWGANVRSRLLALPYGDQGLILSRALYAAAGGYPEVRVMEDVMLSRALQAHGGVRLLDAHIVVSARRWKRDGVWRRSLHNLSLLARFLGGAAPERLAGEYAAQRHESD